MSSSSPSGCTKPGSRRAARDRVARVFVTGANWSAAIVNPFRRFGSTGEGLENTLAKVRANASQPVICALHLASARLQFADRGKSSIILTDDAEQPDDYEQRPRNIANDILDCVETATAKWTRQKKSEERHPGNIRYRVSRMTKEPRTTQKEAAWEVMEAAYMAASGDGRLPATARQIYYQARPKIMALTDDKELQYGYFSQTLLPDYIEEHGVDWDVVYDARGHFEEPHTNRQHRLRHDRGRATISTRRGRRRSRPPTSPARASTSSAHRATIAAVLFCEKEGFSPLFKAVNLANRYDLMVVSSKGVSGHRGAPADRHRLRRARPAAVRVARLRRCRVPDLRARCSATPARYQFSNGFEVVDLGLGLPTSRASNESRPPRPRPARSLLREQLAENGATAEEIAILINERVELNAMTSDALIAMIETKLQAYGLEKVVPDEDLLAKTYCAFRRSERLRERFEEMEEEFDEERPTRRRGHPERLAERVRAGPRQARRPSLGRRRPDRARRNALDRVRGEKEKAKKKSGDFTDDEDDE